MSARISGVKNFESKAASLVRGLPFSQVQSQSEKGSILSFFPGSEVGPLAIATVAGCCVEVEGGTFETSAGGAAGALAGAPAFAGAAGAAATCSAPVSAPLLCSTS